MNTSNDLIRIRPIDPSHISQILRIAEASNLSPWSANDYLDELKRPNSILIRAEGESGQTIGFAVGRIVPAADCGVSVDAELYNIAIDLAYRNCGSGQTLLEAFIDECRKKLARKAWLEVRKSNTAAISLYKKNGFTVVQTRKGFYNNPSEDALTMSMHIN